MINILWVFGSLESLTIIVTVFATLWGAFHNWEMEILVPPVIGMGVTCFLAICFLLSTCGFYWAQ